MATNHKIKSKYNLRQFSIILMFTAAIFIMFYSTIKCQFQNLQYRNQFENQSQEKYLNQNSQKQLAKQLLEKNFEIAQMYQQEIKSHVEKNLKDVTFNFDFKTHKGRKHALQTYIYLQNQLGNRNLLPLSLNYGFTNQDSDSNSIVQYSIENNFISKILRRNLVNGPSCLEWETEKPSLTKNFDSICTNKFLISSKKQNCGGKYGKSNKNNQIDFCTDIQNISGIIPHEKFNSVISIDIFEHLENPIIASQNVFKILKKGGTFILVVPQNGIFEKEKNNYFQFTVQGVIQLLQNSGFCVQFARGLTTSFSCIQHLTGFTTKEIDSNQLNQTDDVSPCVIGAIAKKPKFEDEICEKGDFPTTEEIAEYQKDWRLRIQAQYK